MPIDVDDPGVVAAIRELAAIIGCSEEEAIGVAVTNALKGDAWKTRAEPAEASSEPNG